MKTICGIVSLGCLTAGLLSAQLGAGHVGLAPGPTPGTAIVAFCDNNGNIVKEYAVARYSDGFSAMPLPQEQQVQIDCTYNDNMQNAISRMLQVPSSLKSVPSSQRLKPEALALANPLPPILNLPFPPIGPLSSPPPTPTCDPTSSFFVVNHYENTVTRLNACPLSFSAAIPVASNPLQVAITPDGSTAVVSSYDNAVNFIDTNTNTSSTMNVSSSLHPCGVAITPDGKRAYVTNLYDVGASVLVIDIASRSLVATIPVNSFYPQNVSITPDGSQAWVTYYQNNAVTVIDTLTNTVATNLAVPMAQGIAFDPAGTTAYVASSSTPGQLYLIDTSNFNTIKEIPLGSQPVDVAVSPDGALVFVNNFGGGTSVIDRLSNQVIGTVATAAGTRGISFVP